MMMIIQQTVNNTVIPVPLTLSGWPEASSFALHVSFIEQVSRFLQLSVCRLLIVSVCSSMSAENTGQENGQPVDQEINLFQELCLPHVA
jgi:hypothetical protein